jgi:hypothetical protein
MDSYIAPDFRRFVTKGIDNTGGIKPPLPDFGNFDAGCCTCASIALAEMFSSTVARNATIIRSKARVLADYSDVGAIEGAAYDPSTGANDNGCNMLDVLNYMRKQGRIIAFGDTAKDHLYDSLWLYGFVLLGLSLPDDWREQMPSGIWDLVGKRPNPDNGHEVTAILDGTDNTIKVATWDGFMVLPPRAIDGMVDDCKVAILPSWIRADGTAPSSFDLKAMLADRAIVAT